MYRIVPARTRVSVSVRRCGATTCGWTVMLQIAALVCASLVVTADASDGPERGDGHGSGHNTVSMPQTSRQHDVASAQGREGSFPSPPPPALPPSSQPSYQDVLPGALTRRAFRFSQTHPTATSFLPDAADALGAAIALLATTAGGAGGELVLVGGVQLSNPIRAHISTVHQERIEKGSHTISHHISHVYVYP